MMFEKTLKVALKLCAQGNCTECPIRKEVDCTEILAGYASSCIESLEEQLKVARMSNEAMRIRLKDSGKRGDGK